MSKLTSGALGGEALKSAGMSFASSAVCTAAQLASQLVLTRLLLPDAFGVYAIASSIVLFFEVVRRTGASRILVQRHREFDSIAGSVFWVSLAISIACGLGMAALSPLLARAYASPKLLPVLILLSFRFPLSSLGLISQAKLEIELKWTHLTLIRTMSYLANVAMILAMAYWNYAELALVIPSLVTEPLAALAYRVSCRSLPRLSFSKQRALELVRPSFYITATSLTVIARTQATILLLGFFLTAAELGIFYYATALSAIATRVALGSIFSGLFPLFTRLSGDRGREQAAFLRVFHTGVLVGALVTALQIGLAMPIFAHFVGSQYQGGVLIFAIASIAAFCNVMTTPVCQPFDSHGNFGKTLRFGIVFAAFELAIFVLTVGVCKLLFSVQSLSLAVAGATMATAVANLVAWHRYTFFYLGYDFSVAFAPFWRVSVAVIAGACAGTVMFASARYLGQCFFSSSGMVLDGIALLVASLSIVLVYFGLTWLLWREAILHLYELGMRYASPLFAKAT